ncbi:uncharacterized protein MKK02DRAFT_45767 [Dioszegia hungarica]|uniref:DUF6534 domain-containing protein n=1 Tax=Dioszegia hungarica TaxID=4972 RepID=A0AA38H9X3_9TREE|nr:uncharacterized protein MKK02DRAFT_45767 [Dioszegia hungarica]KAI9637058.1 hypothetical protein MKK02DRAFT_45767 [Dioszegia hungarica]
MASIMNNPALMEALAGKVLSADRSLNIMPFFMSGWLDSMLMGLVVAQVFTYWRFVKTDKKHIVALVFEQVLTTLASTVASGIILSWMQYLFVWNFANWLPLIEITWILRYLGVDFANVLIVHTFYIDRACRLYRHWWPAALLGPLTVGGATLGFAAEYYINTKFKYIDTEGFNDIKIKGTIYGWLSLVLASDLIITIIMTHGLYRVKTGWAHTDSRLRRVMIRCFEAQVPALISAIVNFVAWNRQFQVALVLIAVMTKVYTLGMLITLNLRASQAPVAAVNVSYPSNRQSARTSDPRSEVTDRSPIRHAQVSIDKQSWSVSSGPTAHSEIDIEMARRDDGSDEVDEKAFESTTGLTAPGKAF